MSGLLPSGRPWSSRLHFNSGSNAAVVEASWVAHVNGAWTGGASALQALYPVGTTIAETKTEELVLTHVVSPGFTGDKLFSAVQAFDTVTLPGTGVGDSVPDNVAVLVSLRTAETGRPNRGRMRLPGPILSLVTDSAISSTTAGKYSTAINGIRTNMAADGHTLVLVTYKLGHTLLPVGRTINVSQIATDEVLRSERGRSKRRKAIYV